MISEKRIEHMKQLSEDHDVALDIVCEIAEFLGETEDYDGLVSEVELYAWLFGDKNYE
jgi:hypothetical protein